MKNKMILVGLLFCTVKVFSQAESNSISMGNEFAMLAAHGGNGSNFSAYQSYSNNQVNGSQFFLPDWSKGEITLTNKETFSEGILLAYDKVRQELFFKQKDAKDILLSNKEDIHAFALKNDGRVYQFVNSNVYSKESPEVFYEVLVSDPVKISLLKYTKGTFVKADKTDMMKQTSGEVYDSFVDNVIYYVSKGNGDLQPIQFKTKSLKKTFAELNINIEPYLNNHPEPINEEYLVGMVTELNK